MAAGRRTLFFLTVLVVVCVSSTACNAAPARDQRVSSGSPAHVPANIRVTGGRFVETGEPALAVNPRDPQDLLGATQDINPHPGPAPGSFASHDGGKSWSDNGLLPLPAGDHVGGDVTVAFNRAGTGFVLSHAGPGGFDVNRLLLWRTDDGGRHFDKPTVVFNGHGLVIDHPSLAVDTTTGPHAGSIYATWTAGVAARFPLGSRLYLSRSRDGGKTFSRARTIVQFRVQFPAVPVASVDGSGGLHILVTVGSGDPYHPPFRPFARVLLSSTDGGQSFGSPQRLAAEPVFLPLRGITTANIGAIASYKRATYVAIAGSHGGATDILVWRSTDGGGSWHRVAAISPVPGIASQCFQPQLAISARGTVYLSYLAIKNRRVTVYVAHSTDHRAAFTSSRQISSSSFNPRFGDKTRSPEIPWIGDYQALAAGSHAIYAVWTDTRTTKMQLFAASIAGR
jgi:hypothetical protein